MNFFVILLIVALMLSIYFCRSFYLRIKETKSKNDSMTKELEILKSTLIQNESDKQKVNEKNRKLWQMSETVHKERKLIDEANEKLSLEKEKLEADKKKLDEKIKKLWSTSTAIHKEKERINELKIEIENKHQEILDSVNYAQRIQRALLANKKILDENLVSVPSLNSETDATGRDYFVLFMPKDIVSGDFYWAQKMGNDTFSIVTADSTGHGVPGAIMSILNISCINEAVNAQNLLLPNQILDYTRKRIMEHMANDGSAEGGKDGMDAIICNFNFKTNQLKFAAANNPLYIIRNGELIEYKSDKMPVGKPMGDVLPFTLQEVDLIKGDLVIMITDGFADQFGGANGKKFMYKKLKELFVSISNETTQAQKTILETTFNTWKGSLEQVDDVCIIGIRV